jgi:hypothetical protein
MNEVWNLGPQKLRPPAAAAGWRAIGVDMRLREACLSTPQPLRHRLPCVCLVGAGYPRCSRPIRSRRTGLVPFIPAGGGALYPAARTVNQQVEVLHFTSWAARIARGGCSVPGGCTATGSRGQHLAGRCSSDGRVLGVRVPERAEAVSCRDHGRDPRGRPRRAPREGEETQTGKTPKKIKRKKEDNQQIHAVQM